MYDYDITNFEYTFKANGLSQSEIDEAMDRLSIYCGATYTELLPLVQYFIKKHNKLKEG
jgi:hypothetical protein